MSQHVLEVKNLVKDYGTYRAADSISFNIQHGEVLGLLGPNGAGKSTTIHMLLGITLPTTGDINYFGKSFRTNHQASMQRINFASAYNTLQGRISVQENLIFFAGLYGVKKPLGKIAELLEYFEMSDFRKHKYWDLSAGERTRVNLVKSLLNDPELIMMDEPTASLDPDIADKTLTLIERLRKDRNLSILFTSHNMDEVERICDQVIFLDKGKIISRGTPAEHLSKFVDVDLAFYYKGDKLKLDKLLTDHGLNYEISGNRTVVKVNKEQVGSLVAEVTNDDINITDMEINKPSLEDVFLDIARREK